MAVSVEVRADARENSPRSFRLSRSVSEQALLLERPAAFEVGQPVLVTFTLPDVIAAPPLTVHAVVTLTDSDGDGAEGGRELRFVDPSREARQSIVHYVAGRLGLPSAATRE